jgi:hypothetical protein
VACSFRAHLASSPLQEKERLAQTVDELNDIVFSKTFKAPSAWADRERKYKMDARDWDVEVCRPPESPAISNAVLRFVGALRSRQLARCGVRVRQCPACGVSEECTVVRRGLAYCKEHHPRDLALSAGVTMV